MRLVFLLHVQLLHSCLRLLFSSCRIYCSGTPGCSPLAWADHVKSVHFNCLFHLCQYELVWCRRVTDASYCEDEGLTRKVTRYSCYTVSHKGLHGKALRRAWVMPKFLFKYLCNIVNNVAICWMCFFVSFYKCWSYQSCFPFHQPHCQRRKKLSACFHQTSPDRWF